MISENSESIPENQLLTMCDLERLTEYLSLEGRGVHNRIEMKINQQDVKVCQTNYYIRNESN